MECITAKESNTEPSLTMTFIRMFGLRYILLGCVLLVVVRTDIIIKFKAIIMFL